MVSQQRSQGSKGVPDFSIVGIGASAGGLSAAGLLLDNTPADTGMAFVLVFHLDPARKSEAAELLQRHTQMPVAQVTKRTRVKPDHVYVVPPNHGLMLDNGALVLTELERIDGRPTVIDHFFRSLATAAGEHAIGVVLSGMGSEGSQGLKTIKEAGGLTVVQREEEAEYSGMPHSAISTGLIDFVVPVAEIPAKLREVRDFAVDLTLSDAEHEREHSDAEILQKIFVQLRTQVGHDFTHYKRNTVLRRIARRMQVHQLQELDEYLQLLRNTPAECEALFRELLISVTNFFRDPDAMAVVEHEVMPRLCRDGENRSVRVWVPGCATGEEAYSLAMLLLEACDDLGSPPRLQIFASDVDDRALNVARRGFYPAAVAGDVSKARLTRFFDRDGDGFVVKPFVRELILFTRHDLLGDPPFSRLDLISCRNVLIYLKADIQNEVFALFHFALKAHGYLFLGGSESLGQSSKLFAELDRKAKLFQACQVPATNARLPLQPNLARASTRSHDGKTKPKGFEDIARDELLTSYAPPCVIVGENYDVTYVSGRVGQYLEPGRGEANYNILDMAREGLRVELRTALYRAFHAGEGVHRKPVQLDGTGNTVGLTVRPLKSADGHALVAFEELGKTEPAPTPPRNADEQGIVAQLEDELTNTRESLQTSIEELETSNEELRASNEELQSVNEELQSTTEELETGKEELQSTNEELLAVNQELTTRNDELGRSNSDLNNFIASTDIGTLFLDENLRVRRYTPRVTDIFNLIAGDVGRPLAHVTNKLDTDTLLADAGRVVRDLTMVEREIASTDGRVYQMRMRPYRAVDNKLGGVVLTFVDVTERQQREQQTRDLNTELAHQRAYAESIVATVREPMLVLDGDLRVVSASRSFYRAYETTPPATEKTLLYDLGQKQWDIPELRRLLEEVLPERNTVDGFEVRHDFGDGERVMLLNARSLKQDEGPQPLILLAIEDVTEREHAEAALRETEMRSRQILDSAIDYAIMAMDAAGRITAWNEGAHRVLGWTERDMLGQGIERIYTPGDRAAGQPERDMQRAREGEHDSVERWHVRRNGEKFWASGEVTPLHNDAGKLAGFIKVLSDRTAERRADQHRVLLIHELNHRVKNTLATVQALAMQTFRGAGAKHALATFEARLLALSAVHDVLTRENWQAAGMHEVVDNAMAAFRARAKARITLAGPDLRLRPAAALAIAMALHELLTNAAKYGALSNKSGKVSVRWEVSDAAPARLRLHWRERGGPPVAPPTERGFGSRLVEHALARDLDGNVELTFEPDGVECIIDAPVDGIREADTELDT